MKKAYKVPNHKKSERNFKNVGSIGELINNYENHGSRTALAWKNGEQIEEMSFGDFGKQIKAFYRGLKVRLGEDSRRIAVIGETSVLWVTAYCAIIASGNTVVPMDRELAPEEIAKFFEAAGVSAVVYSSSFNKTMEEICAGHPTIEYLIPMDAGVTGSSVITCSEIIASGIGAESVVPYEPDGDLERCAEILFTSGTTGTSKMVQLCQRNICTAINAAGNTVEFVPDDVLVSVLPLHHTYELMCFLTALNYGCKLCINDSLRHVLKNFKDFQPTALVLVPLFISTMYRKIMSEAKKSGKDKILLPAVRAARYLKLCGIDMSEKLFSDVREAFGGRLVKIISGGAELPTDMIAIFEAFGISIFEGYGITECSPLVSVTPYYKRKLGSVGPHVPGCEVRIDSIEKGESGYVTGEIQVKGDNVMLGYADPAANEDAFTEDGWYRTGDIGYMDKDGYIYITGRMKSVIVLENGKNVFPEEIEEYLDKIDLIAESVVVGRQEGDSVRLCAVIFPNYEKDPSLTESELRSAIQKEITQLNKRLPSFKQIHKLEFRKVEFEKTTSKKIKRHLVK